MRCFLVLILLACSCNPGGKDNALRVVEEGGSITALSIPKSLINGNQSTLRISLEGSEETVLGKFHEGDSEILFEPAVPLSHGQTYVVAIEGGIVGTITMPESKAPAPELLAIYPLTDTVPENLLKVYLRFSRPMMEGRSASFVHLLKDGRDTMRGTFLDLQPELWSGDGTVLTLWLDPGRIKLDLIPNKELGNPLKKGWRYELVVDGSWKSKEGKSLGRTLRKAMFVGERDEVSPEVDQWTIRLPASGSREPLVVNFGEPLDRMLAEGTLFLLNARRDIVDAQLRVGPYDRRVQFIPEMPWTAGDYVLAVESRLEDLAGNNLNRLFETDLTQPNRGGPAKGIHERAFKIR